MNKIIFPRTSYDGSVLTQKELENWFSSKVEDDIRNNLKGISTTLFSEEEKELLLYFKINLKDILLASPEKLKAYKEYVENNYSPEIFRKEAGHKARTKFGKKILNAFNYKGYRETVLVELAEKLNVKTCPYCNMHYTLFAEKEGTKEDDGKIDKLAKFQFDHFFDKSDYPFLSMSLYNLIPSCASCNQGKSTSTLDLKFHPYNSAICEQFHFEVEDPLLLYSGARKDKININIINDMSEDKEKLSSFIETFHIKTLYSRHKDIAQETFDKAYEDPYYLNPSNFNFTNDKDSDYLKRLWMGTYSSTDEIEKRPMTKFIQDLWNQAKQQKNDLL